MRELQVPTRRVGVRLFTSHGRPFSGAMFLHESRFHDSLAKEVLAELNDERVFLPFHAEDPSMGRIILHKNHILRVHMGDDDPDVQRSQFDETSGAPCTMVMDDGSEVQGRLLVAVPTEASRLLDRLNSACRFLPLAHETGLVFIHRDHVARVY